jgi:dihydroflavonol-4-reductase
MRGADGVIHAAGSYRVGISRNERPAMWAANVGTTEQVLDAAIAAQVSRIAYVSTVNVFGNTHGRVVDETYHRDLADGFVSWYDETKYRAHEVAESRIHTGAPVVIAMPSQVYGPFDHSAASGQLELAYHGKLPYIAFAATGLGWVHVDDLAVGVANVLEHAGIGETYVLSGERCRLGEAVAIAAQVGGKRPPRLRVPTAALRLVAPLNDRFVHLPGMPQDLGETIQASDGVTYWASAAKAERELGFTARPLEQGLRDTFGGGSG